MKSSHGLFWALTIFLMLVAATEFHANAIGSRASPFVSSSTQHELVARATQKAKKVFAHYMVGTTTEEHANQDVDDAIAMGLDGFALNIGDPSQSFVTQTLAYLFGHAAYRGNFYLYISMDVYASGNSCYQGNTLACGGPTAYQTILQDNLGQSAWFKGPNGLPMISTYSSGGLHNDTWQDWKDFFADTMYFIPDFDETEGYYDSADAWWTYWGDIVDGLFSWEAAWPYRSGYGGDYPGDISPDLPVLAGASEHDKGYMMALSPLQYKDSYGANVYRAGDLNLPTRMENILAMEESPDYIQIITWNDGPESHYIGNIWLEQNNDTQPYRYANAIDWDHTGWQPLITSFINAWKEGKTADAMEPPSNAPVGAMWYKTILESSVCPTDQNPLTYNYSIPADGFSNATDQLNYAVVVEPGGSYTLQAYTGGVALTPLTLDPGLNYGSFSGVRPGSQRMELLSGDSIALAATGGRCISSSCPDCVYNMNQQVIPFVEDTGSEGYCPYMGCKRAVFAHYMVGNIYEEHAQQDIDDAAAMGFDGFALNVGDPTQDYVLETFEYMFNYAWDNDNSFKLFLSMDLWAEGNAFNGTRISAYQELLELYRNHPAYLTGPDGNPFVSTFSSGGLVSSDWIEWLAEWSNEIYLVPDFDDTAGYYGDDSAWWEYWGDIVSGTFSWESAWPQQPEQIAQIGLANDTYISEGAFQHLKSYMAPISPLQYKDSYDTNYFRAGNLNLAKRMEDVLSLDPIPPYAEYITWNDGPESHYIGNLWTEQNNDTQPQLYANSDASHEAWRPLMTSFINAFKAGYDSSNMTPPDGQSAVGALWYSSILQTAECPGDGNSIYTAKPEGFANAKDQLNWAMTLAEGQGGLVRGYSNGTLVGDEYEISGPGLFYGFFDGIQAGFQRVELQDSDGNVIMSASGGRCISDGCPDCIYNLNPVVVPFTEGSGQDSGPCPSADCQAADVLIPPSIWTDPEPIIGCEPPCTIVLPPYPLGSTTTVYWPLLTTSLWVSESGTSQITATVISIPPVTTTEIPFWPISVGSTDTFTTTVTPVQSVVPPYYTLTLPGSEATIPPTTSIVPYTLGQSSIFTPSSPTPTFQSTNYTVVILPQPTKSVTITSIPVITYSSGAPSSLCTAGCGQTPACSIFGCPSSSTSSDSSSGSSTPTQTTSAGSSGSSGSNQPSNYPHCGFFGCWGGCGIWGCSTPDIGGCGLGGCGSGCTDCGTPCTSEPCPTACPLNQCGGLNCEGTGNCNGPDGDSGNNDNCSADSPEYKTASDCVAYCTVTSTNSIPSTSCTSTTCFASSTGCGVTGVTTSVTSTGSSWCPTITAGTDLTLGDDIFEGCYACSWYPIPLATDGVYAPSPGYDEDDDFSDNEPQEFPQKRGLDRRTWPGPIPTPTPKTLLKNRADDDDGAKLGACSIDPALASTLDHTKGQAWLTSETDGALEPTQTTMPRWWSTTTSACIPTLTKVGFDTMVAEGKNKANKFISKPTIDHAYEKGWLTDFFKMMFDGTSTSPMSCDAGLNLFFDGPCGNQLQPIWQLLASNKYWDMVGMTFNVNSAMKGLLSDKQRLARTVINRIQDNPLKVAAKYGPRSKPFKNKSDLLKEIALGCDILRSDDVFQPLNRTNSRIYNAFLQLDNYIVARDLYGTKVFAEAYKDWVTQRLAQIFSSADVQAKKLIQVLESDIYTLNNPIPTDTQSINTAQGLIQSFESVVNYYNLAGADSICLGYTFDLSWGVDSESYLLSTNDGESCLASTSTGTSTTTPTTATTLLASPYCETSAENSVTTWTQQWISPAQITSAASSFCSAYDGKDAPQSVLYSEGSVQATFRASSMDVDSTCPGDHPIDEDICNSAYGTIATDCSGTMGEVWGGYDVYECLKYEIILE